MVSRRLALAGLLLLPVAVAQPAEAHRRHGRKAKVVRAIPNASDELLACIYHHESRGRYDAVSRSGRYRGAAQFDARTWRGSVARAGLGEWSGTPVNEVPADVQDAAVRQLLAERGLRPCVECGGAEGVRVTPYYDDGQVEHHAEAEPA